MGWCSKNYNVGSISLNSRGDFNEDKFDEFMVELNSKIEKFVSKEIETKFQAEIDDGNAIIFVNI